MTQAKRADDGARGAEPKFYIPAGSTRSLVVGRLQRLWTALFDHRVDGPLEP